MGLGSIVLTVIPCAFFVYMICLFSRMFRVHNGPGTFVLLRQPGKQRWVHAKIFYTPEGLRYITHNYKLQSGIIDRTSIELLPNSTFDQTISIEKTISMTSCKLKTDSLSYELASTVDTVTALQSWVESSPSIRQVPRPTWVHRTKFYSQNEI